MPRADARVITVLGGVLSDMRRSLASLTRRCSSLVGAARGRSRPADARSFPSTRSGPAWSASGARCSRATRSRSSASTILGVLRNVIGPQRDLILARLEGGPLANTGVIAGMSGSPVYIDGRLVGAVSYSLGSFPKEPLAGITPIGEMIDDVERRRRRAPIAASGGQVAGAAGRGLCRARPRGSPGVGAARRNPWRHVGRRPALAGRPRAGPTADRRRDGAGRLRRPHSTRDLRAGARRRRPLGARRRRPPALAGQARPLRPGDPIGMSLIRGDLEMGATGTVTHVDGDARLRVRPSVPEPRPDVAGDDPRRTSTRCCPAWTAR